MIYSKELRDITTSNIIDDGRLACLRHEFLDLVDHVVSHSAYFKALQGHIIWPEIADLDAKGRAKVKQLLGPPNGLYSLSSLMDAVPEVRVYVEQHMPGCLAEQNAADMRVELACHLHSSVSTPRTSHRDAIFKLAEQYIDSVPLPQTKTKTKKKTT